MEYKQTIHGICKTMYGSFVFSGATTRNFMVAIYCGVHISMVYKVTKKFFVMLWKNMKVRDLIVTHIFPLNWCDQTQTLDISSKNVTGISNSVQNSQIQQLVQEGCAYLYKKHRELSCTC